MKQILLIIGLVLASTSGYAYDMMDILSKGYDAKTLSAYEMDSVLSQGAAEPSSRYRLEYENEQKLFRHSFLADYYLIDTQKDNAKIPLSDQPVRDAVLSPNGKYVVYAKADNNLYIYKVDFKTEVAVTTDENTEIFNGINSAITMISPARLPITTLLGIKKKYTAMATINTPTVMYPYSLINSFLSCSFLINNQRNVEFA